MTIRHSPEAVAALIRMGGISPHQRKVLIGAAATLRRARPLSSAQEHVVNQVMREALRDDAGFEPIGQIAARVVADATRDTDRKAG
jgi:hypothetical protein